MSWPWVSRVPYPGIPVESGTVERIEWHRIDAGTDAQYDIIVDRPDKQDKLRIRSLTLETSNPEYWNCIWAYFRIHGTVRQQYFIPFTVIPSLYRGFVWRPPFPQDWDKEAEDLRISYRLNGGSSTTTRLFLEWERY